MHIWRAYLEDGSIIEEDKDNRYPSSEDLPKSLVARMEYVSLDAVTKPVGVDIDLKNGERFFRFWRKSLYSRISGVGPPPPSDLVCVVGIEKNGEKQVSVYIYPDNTVVVSTNHEL